MSSFGVVNYSNDSSFKQGAGGADYEVEYLQMGIEAQTGERWIENGTTEEERKIWRPCWREISSRYLWARQGAVLGDDLQHSLLCVAGFIRPVRNDLVIMNWSLLLFPQLSLTRLATKHDPLTRNTELKWEACSFHPSSALTSSVLRTSEIFKS